MREKNLLIIYTMRNDTFFKKKKKIKLNLFFKYCVTIVRNLLL
jgi:hypothetical protein